METIHECKNCGKAFKPTCHTSRQIYCSKACRIRNNNAGRYNPPGNACVECGTTLDHKEHSGRNRRFCGDECRKLNYRKKLAEKKRLERQKPRVCPNCGKEFQPLWEKGGVPRFCSDECRVEWWQEYHKANTRPEEPNKTCGYCGKKMEGREGKYCSRVCYRLGAARVRGEKRCAWCGKILSKRAQGTRKYCSAACASAEWSLGQHTENRRCITAHNPKIWRRQLAELTKKMAFEHQKDKRLLLVGDAANLVSTETLVNIIRYHLKCDPFDGNRYIFSNNIHTMLKWVEWDGGGFCVGYRQSEWGKYPWPRCKPGTVMEITEQEFEYLLSKSINGNRAENH